MSLRVGFKITNPHLHLVHSLLWASDRRCELSDVWTCCHACCFLPSFQGRDELLTF